MGERTDNEDTSIGGITWHSTDEDSGPDVGISVIVGENDRLWCGEISRALFDDQNGPEHFPDDMGWFLVRYGPNNDTKLIAKFSDQYAAQEFIEEIASWCCQTASNLTEKAE